MQHMQEAYEVLIDKLKKELEELHKKTSEMSSRENKIITMLVEIILQKMPKAAALRIGKEIDEEVGEGSGIERYMMTMLEEVDE